MTLSASDDDDDLKDDAATKGRKEFDCPSCNANNPTENIVKDGDELLCNYCGSEFDVRLSSEGRLKLREV